MGFNLYLTKEEVNQVAKWSIGKSFKEISNDITINNKGVLGQLLETAFFHIDNNSKSSPDFEEAGVELKLTPYIVNKNGNIVNRIEGNIVYNNFPKQSDSSICHVRPHAKNANDTYPLPVMDVYTKRKKFTKQCFWLNNEYIKEVIKEI